MTKILPIIEGDGDLKAVPIIIRRILEDNNLHSVGLHPAQKRGDLPKIARSFDNYFNAALKWQAPILWVLDFDCKNCICQADEAMQLYKQAENLRPSWPFKVVFVTKEFETLFLIEQQAARKVLGIDENYAFPPTPEKIRGAKQVLSRALPSGRSYKEMVHQDKIAAQLNLDVLREHSSDFRHLEKSVLYLANPQG